ncbi:MAG: hypothetical protein AAFR76_01570 [Planctomycetota bacterium]
MSADVIYKACPEKGKGGHGCIQGNVRVYGSQAYAERYAETMAALHGQRWVVYQISRRGTYGLICRVDGRKGA